jgi:AcrR family transcriptional regulator
MDRTELILHTARKHFSRYGYTKTTMEEISRDCKITKPTLYAHFASKVELFKAVIDLEQQKCNEDIAIALSGITSTSEKLAIYARVQVESLRKFINIGGFFSRQAIFDYHPDMYNIYKSYRKREEEFIAGCIYEGIRANEFTPVNIETTAGIFYLLIAIIKLDVLLASGSDNLIENAESIIPELSSKTENAVKIFLQGIIKRN